MTFEITIKPSDHAFSCEQGETVLAAAMRADLMLPYGCRNGACGTCKGKILAGEVDYGAHQKSTLTEDEKRIGYALFCVAKPLTDVTIEVREVRRAGDIVDQAPAVPARVDRQGRARRRDRALQAAGERAAAVPRRPVHRLPAQGRQAAQLLARHAAARRQAPRAPHPPRAERFFTDALFTQYKGREILRFEGPLGSFYLREQSDKPIVFVAGGTGFAPIKAIIEHALHHELDRKMVLYWGARSRPDLYLPDLPQQWQATHRNFTYVPVLSEPKPEDDWTGRTGFVHRAVMEDFPDLSGHQVYACGAPAMIDAARRDFTQQSAAAARRILRRQLHVRRGNRSAPVGRDMLHGQRVIVVMPAYRAEKTLAACYAAIPHDVVDESCSSTTRATTRRCAWRASWASASALIATRPTAATAATRRPATRRRSPRAPTSSSCCIPTTSTSRG